MLSNLFIYLDYNLINFAANNNQFLNVFNIAPTTSINNISIINSKGANIQVLWMDTINVRNVLIQNNSLSTRRTVISLIYFSIAHKAVVSNLIVRNHTGSVLRLHGILSQIVEDCLFENVTNSQLTTMALQNMMRIIDSPSSGLNLTKERLCIIRNVSLDVIMN